MENKSKILFVGGTGYIGKFIVEASAKAGNPTYLLVRESTLSDPSKSDLLNKFKSLGVYFATVSHPFSSILMISLYIHVPS